MRLLVIAVLLAASLAIVPGASAAPCNADYFSGVNCFIDYAQIRTDFVIDEAEEDSGQDLSLVQDTVNHKLDTWGEKVDEYYPDYIPCVTHPGPVCW